MATTVTTEPVVRSEYKALDLKDLAKSAGTAAFTTALAGIYLWLNSNTIPTWVETRVLIMSTLASFVGNIIRSGLTNSNGQFLKGEKSATLEKEASNS